MFAQYNATAVAAYLRGGSTAALTLAQIKAVTGTLNAIIDGYTYPIASLDLSSATSQSSAAGIIQTGLNASKPTQATAVGSISGTVFTAASSLTGAFAPGQILSGSGVTVGTTIIAQLTGPTGGLGTYTVSASQTASSTGMTAKGQDVAVTFDSVSNAFIITSGTTGAISTAAFCTGTAAAPLLLTLATGAMLSQGAAAATPGGAMSAITLITQNWATFMTAFDPDGGSGNTVKQAFAAWNTAQNNRYAYICWDPDVTPEQSVPATNSLGYILVQNGNSGTVLISETSFSNYAQFACSYAASLDFTRQNGRTTIAFRSQPGLVALVTDQQTAINLGGNPQVNGDFGNGYNYYGAFATANSNFVNFQRGTITGKFQWFDSYVNQIWLNNQFQLALMNLLQNTNSIPYNRAGNSIIEAALADPISAAVNFGAIRAGVALSNAQISEVNQSAGLDISSALQTQGWYLQIGVANSSVRQNRGSPPMTFWYVDGESVQSFTLASILIQ